MVLRKNVQWARREKGEDLLATGLEGGEIDTPLGSERGVRFRTPIAGLTERGFAGNNIARNIIVDREVLEPGSRFTTANGDCLVREMLVREMAVREMAVREMAVGETAAGEIAAGRWRWQPRGS